MRGDHWLLECPQTYPRFVAVSMQQLVQQRLEGQTYLTRHVKNCIGVFRSLLQHLDGLFGGQDEQPDFVTRGFALDFPHHGQASVGSAAHDELTAFPGNLFFYRERRMAELFLKFLGRFLLTFANFAAINNHIVLVWGAIDANGTERKPLKMHTHSSLDVLMDTSQRWRSLGLP